LFILAAESGQGFPQCPQAQVIFAASSLDAIKECGDVNYFAASFEEVKIENLLSRHALHWK